MWETTFIYSAEKRKVARPNQTHGESLQKELDYQMQIVHSNRAETHVKKRRRIYGTESSSNSFTVEFAVIR